MFDICERLKLSNDKTSMKIEMKSFCTKNTCRRSGKENIIQLKIDDGKYSEFRKDDKDDNALNGNKIESHERK